MAEARKAIEVIQCASILHQRAPFIPPPSPGAVSPGHFSVPPPFPPTQGIDSGVRTVKLALSTSGMINRPTNHNLIQLTLPSDFSTLTALTHTDISSHTLIESSRRTSSQTSSVSYSSHLLLSLPLSTFISLPALFLSFSSVLHLDNTLSF